MSSQPHNQPWRPSGSQGKPPLPSPLYRPQLNPQSVQQRSHIPQQQQQTPSGQQSQSSLSHQPQEHYGQQFPSSRIQQSLPHHQVTRVQGLGNQKLSSQAMIQPSAIQTVFPGAEATAEPVESCNKILSNRSIQELVTQIDPSEKLDPEVEDILVDIADEFVESVVAYDYGIKHNILRRLASYWCKITVVPSTWPASKTLNMKPDGVFLSNGPGDPSAVPCAVESVKEIIGKVPILGICMGHQMLGQALGGKTYKMKFGHHGGNHPVRNLRTGCVEISDQNHNYAVDPASLPNGVEVTHVNLNDGSCAGLAFLQRKLMSLQYHPEASPGPHDSDPGEESLLVRLQQEKLQALLFI